MRNLDILRMAVLHETLHVAALDDHRHTLLRLAYGQLRGVQSAVLHGHAVEVYVQTGGQLANCDTDAAGTEVVRLLDQARNLRTAEQTLQFALLGGISLLHLRTALLDRLDIVLLRRSRRTSYTVTARTSAQQQYDITRSGRLAPYVLGLDGTDHGTHLQTLGHIVGMVYFAHVRRGKTYLVAVARISGCGLGADDTLRQLALERLRHTLVYIARTGHTHGLIDITAS